MMNTRTKLETFEEKLLRLTDDAELKYKEISKEKEFVVAGKTFEDKFEFFHSLNLIANSNSIDDLKSMEMLEFCNAIVRETEVQYFRSTIPLDEKPYVEQVKSNYEFIIDNSDIDCKSYYDNLYQILIEPFAAWSEEKENSLDTEHMELLGKMRETLEEKQKG